MNLANYQDAVLRTMHRSETPMQNIPNYCMGAAGELGEVVDHLKKFIYHGHELNPKDVMEELGDVMWYIAAITSELGFDLSDIAEMNIRKLEKRYPSGFSVKDSIERVDAR